ncbi:putative MAPEG superfamily protein [Litorivivens lipolytica]|uniref:Putative MAPEG superfamily protein n=1 Tax=Litorivivens lipolytica TaxID=1524264 RepID=A0A7W4W1Z3_9GAMM|nr:MAPEG family protein [Litorivivens lipolytica]MBB3045906.1 putative MAPEG superfamily protein [Litorivivens lipolytica]
MDLVQSYSSTIGAMAALAVLLFCQVLVADLIGIRSKHIPGTTVQPDHSNLLFRASRTVANTNESVAIFILAVFFCMLSGAAASSTAYAAWAFVVARLLFATCYYANWQLPRSVMFGLSLIALAALLIIGSSAWL